MNSIDLAVQALMETVGIEPTSAIA